MFGYGVPMKHLIYAPLALVLAACATGPMPYGAAADAEARGYMVQPIETGRYRVSYKAVDEETARSYALLRAAELTLESGADWFHITNAYTDEETSRGGGSSVSIGGSSGSYGRSGVGVGVGVGLPLGGGGKEATHVLEILTGSGDKPDDANAYDARSVQSSILGIPAE